VTGSDFEMAMEETCASMIPEMEMEHEKIQESLKQDAMSSGAGIGFISPRMLTPRGAEKVKILPAAKDGGEGDHAKHS
jgi:hypothetical protein